MKMIPGRNGGMIQIKEKGDRLPGAGHPGGENFKTVAARYLSARQKKKNPLSGIEEKLTGMELLVLSLIGKALEGDVAAAREILDRIEGKVQQGLDLTVINKAHEIQTMFPTEDEVRELLQESNQ